MADTVRVDGILNLRNFLLGALDSSLLELTGNPPPPRVGTDREQSRRDQNLGQCKAVLETQAHRLTPECSRIHWPSASRPGQPCPDSRDSRCSTDNRYSTDSRCSTDNRCSTGSRCSTGNPDWLRTCYSTGSRHC